MPAETEALEEEEPEPELDCDTTRRVDPTEVLLARLARPAEDDAERIRERTAEADCGCNSSVAAVGARGAGAV